MSPIEYIEEGIRKGDWQIVCEGFERLTEKSIPLPTAKVGLSALREIHDISAEALGLVCLLPLPTGGASETTVEEKKVSRSKKKKTSKKVVMGKPKADDNPPEEDREDSTLRMEDGITPMKAEQGGSRLITNEPNEGEVIKNRKEAGRSKQNKLQLARAKPRTYKVNCNECDKGFDSDRPGGEMGQKCPKCLAAKKSVFT